MKNRLASCNRRIALLRTALETRPGLLESVMVVEHLIQRFFKQKVPRSQIEAHIKAMTSRAEKLKKRVHDQSAQQMAGIFHRASEKLLHRLATEAVKAQHE